MSPYPRHRVRGHGTKLFAVIGKTTAGAPILVPEDKLDQPRWSDDAIVVDPDDLRPAS